MENILILSVSISFIVIFILFFMIKYKYIYNEKKFDNDVIKNFKDNKYYPLGFKNNLDNTPKIIKKYIEYTGFNNFEKIDNFSLLLKGSMTDEKKNFEFNSRQYNFFQKPSRFFLMKTKILGFSIIGIHNYFGIEAFMKILLMGFFPFINIKNEKLFISETVTFFAEACFYNPLFLLDNRVKLKEVDKYKIESIFENKAISIKSYLYFNENGELIKFESYDRYDISKGKKYKFSILASEYKKYENNILASNVSLIWNYPDRDFIYSKFRVNNILYNYNK